MKTITIKEHETLNGEWKVIDGFEINHNTYYRIRRDKYNDMIVNADASIIVSDVLEEEVRDIAIKRTINELLDSNELEYGKNIKVTYCTKVERTKQILAKLLYNEIDKKDDFNYRDVEDLKIFSILVGNLSIEYIDNLCEDNITYNGYVKVIHMLDKCYSKTVYIPELKSYGIWEFVEDGELISELIKIYYEEFEGELQC